jgi:ribosome-associated protein
MIEQFELKGEFIELIKLLKAMGIADNGGHAQAIVNENKVKLNGIIETRKRAKIKKGDEIEVSGKKIQII